MGKNDLYPSAASQISGGAFYPASSGIELSIRDEVIRTLQGSSIEVAKGQKVLLRRMRRDGDGSLILCDCVDPVTQEQDKDRFCPISFGERYKWDETWMTVYSVLKGANDTSNSFLQHMVPAGIQTITTAVFYAIYSEDITSDDKIVLVKLSDDGDVATPVTRTAVYRINVAWPYRLDTGRIEYWKLFAHEEDVKWLNPPGYDVSAD